MLFSSLVKAATIGVALGAPVRRTVLPPQCDSLADWMSPTCQAYCGRPDAIPTPWCDAACDTPDEITSGHCQSWCDTPSYAAVLPYCGTGFSSVELDRHELGPQYLDIGGRALDGSPALFYYKAPPEGVASTTWAIFLQGGGACKTNGECWGRSFGALGSSVHPDNVAATRHLSDGGLFSEDAATNPGFWDAHKVYVPYLSGDIHLGTRTEPYTFPDDPTWGSRPGQDSDQQPAFYFSGHLNLVHIVEQLSTNATFTANGGGIGVATDVLLTGCSAGGYGARGNADWLLDTLPTTANFRAAPTASLNMGSQTFMNFQGGVPGGFPIPLPEHAPSIAESWQLYIDPTCVENAQAAGRTDEEALEFCVSNEGVLSSMRTPTLWISPQFDSFPLTNQYGNESDLTPADYETAVGQQYLAQWGQESRELLFDNAKFVFASSCLDHCGSSLLTGDAGPLIGDHSSLDVLNDWFFGHNLLPHKLIEGMSPGGVDQQPNSGLPFNPTCRNLVDGSLIGGGDDVSGCAPTLGEACPGYATGTPQGCSDCAIANAPELMAAECTVAIVTDLCVGATQGARISAPAMQALLAPTLVATEVNETEPEEPEPEPETDEDAEDSGAGCAFYQRRGLRRVVATGLAIAACASSALP